MNSLKYFVESLEKKNIRYTVSPVGDKKTQITVSTGHGNKYSTIIDNNAGTTKKTQRILDRIIKNF